MSRIQRVLVIAGYCAVLLACVGTASVVGYRTLKRVGGAYAARAARLHVPRYSEVPVLYFYQPG